MSTSPSLKRWIFLGVGIAAYCAVIIHADPMLLFLGSYAGLWIAAFGTAIAYFIQFVVPGSRRWSHPALLLFLAIGVISVVTLVSQPINGLFQDRAEAEAKAYPEFVAPLLEQYRQEHGGYPTSLDQLPSRPPVPRLLRTRGGYGSDGVHYFFSFPRPGGMIDCWGYSSRTHEWHLST